MSKHFSWKIAVGIVIGFAAGAVVTTPIFKTRVSTQTAQAANGSTYTTLWNVSQMRELSINAPQPLFGGAGTGPDHFIDQVDIGPAQWTTLTCLNSAVQVDHCSASNNPNAAMIKETWSVTQWTPVNRNSSEINITSTRSLNPTLKEANIPMSSFNKTFLNNAGGLYSGEMADLTNIDNDHTDYQEINQFPLQWTVTGTVTTP